jgi:hypothetical protein
MTTQLTVALVICFLGLFAIAGLAAAVVLAIQGVSEVLVTAIAVGPTSVALGGLVGLLASPKTDSPLPPPPVR